MEWVLLSVVKNPLTKIPMTYNILLCLGDLGSSYFPHLSISCSGSLCSSNTRNLFLLCTNPLPKTLCPPWPPSSHLFTRNAVTPGFLFCAWTDFFMLFKCQFECDLPREVSMVINLTKCLPISSQQSQPHSLTEFFQSTYHYLELSYLTVCLFTNSSATVWHMHS